MTEQDHAADRPVAASQDDVRLRFVRLQLQLIGMMSVDPAVLRCVQQTLDFIGEET